MKKVVLVISVIVFGFLFNFTALSSINAKGIDQEEFTLEEITVTAEKREVNIQDTAMSVTAITGEDLASKAIVDLQSALMDQTSVGIQAQPGGGAVFIRGIGTTLGGNLGDPSVSIQVDNVYVGRVEVLSSALYDVERVEVLRGPQGTMYGRNAAGGQINVISKKPTAGKFEGNASFTIGDYNTKNFSTALNIPISSKWSARFAVNREFHEGYTTEGADSADKYAGRVKVLFEPTDRLNFLLTVEKTVDKSAPANTVPVPGSAGNLPRLGPPPAYGYVDEDLVETGWVTEYGNSNPWAQDEYHPVGISDNTFNFYQLEVNYDMGWGQLVMIPALNINSRNFWSELVFGTAMGAELGEQPFEEKQRSFDLRMQSKDDSPIQWITGAFWLDSDNHDLLGVTAQDVMEASEESGNWETSSYRRPGSTISAYGQLTYPVTDIFRLTGGIRYTKDNNKMAYEYGKWDITDTDNVFYPLATVTSDDRHEYDSGLIEYSDKNNNITYRAGLEFDAAEDSMLYAYVTTGYKNGGMNIYGEIPPEPFDPEKLISYSIGSKNRFMDGRMQLNAEAYYYDYDGFQVQCYSQFISALSGTSQTKNLVLNADKGTNAGLEIDADYMITAYDRVSLSAAYMKSEYGTLILPANPVANSMVEYDLTGKTMMNCPELSGTLQYEHTWLLDNGAQVTGKFDSKWSKGYWATHEAYMAGAWQDSYHMSNLYLTWVSPNGTVSVGVYGKNLENADVTTRTLPAYRRIIMSPRTTGCTVSVKF